jgi:hypothetical protein
MGIEEILQKILDKVKDLDNKIDSVLVRLASLDMSKGSGSSSAKVAADGDRLRMPSDVKTDEALAEKPSIEGRVKCPNCGGLNIQQKEDKTKPLDYIAGKPIFGKINYCKQCGKEF